MKKVSELICSCDRCWKTLWDNFQDIKNDWHYVSITKVQSWLPLYLICKECNKKFLINNIF